MSTDPDALRRRSKELGVGTSGEAIATNRAILGLVPADPVASDRLGIALLQLGELAEAEAVLTATLAAHPNNTVARNRLEEVRRRHATAAARPPKRPQRSAGTRRQAASAPTYWIKSLHYHDDEWTIDVGQETWISDIGRRTSDGERVYRADGVPWGEPSWCVGDEIGLYFGGTLKVPVLVTVTSPPEFNPALVQAESHGQEGDAGERWPWVTHVRGVNATPLSHAPTLDDLGIPRDLVQRRPRFTITADQHHRLVQALSP